MKKTLRYLLLGSLALGLAATACQPKDPYVAPDPPTTEDPAEDPNKNPTEEPQQPTGPQPGTYRFVASEMQGSWKAGDQIYVHGNLGTEAETITLAAGDISADGKTATAKLDLVTETPVDPDGLYAAWPAQAVVPYKGILKVKTIFENCEGLLTMSYLKDDTFTFVDVSGLLQFSVSGDYDQFAIASTERDGLGITRFEAEYSSEKQKFVMKQNDGYPYRYGSLEAGSPARLWFPTGFSFGKGYTLFFGKGDQWTATYTTDTPVTFEGGKVLDIGDITASLTPYEGLPPKMPRMGAETKYAVQFNELSGLEPAEDGSFLWTVGDDGDLAKLSLEGEVLWKFHIGGDAEAISRNPETGDLLIGLEPDGVGVVKGPGFNSRVSTLFSLAKAKGYGNAGVEGLTYYKDGLIYVGTQTDSRLFCCKLATGEVLWDKAMYNKVLVSEIADLFYDPLTDWLWIMDSENKKVYVYTGDSETLLGAYPVSGSNPESVCVDHVNNCVWVGDDYGSTSYLYRYEFTGLDDAIQ